MSRSYHVEREIAAPAETVWTLLTDADGYPAWNDAVVSLEGPIRLGADIRLVSVVDPSRTFTLRVTELSPPNRMVWTDGMPLGLFAGTRIYDVDDLGGERCRFSMAESFGGPLAPLVTRFIPDLTDSFELFASSLRRAAEA